jgi:hypothetical protein
MLSYSSEKWCIHRSVITQRTTITTALMATTTLMRT